MAESQCRRKCLQRSQQHFSRPLQLNADNIVVGVYSEIVSIKYFLKQQPCFLVFGCKGHCGRLSGKDLFLRNCLTVRIRAVEYLFKDRGVSSVPISIPLDTLTTVDSLLKCFFKGRNTPRINCVGTALIIKRAGITASIRFIGSCQEGGNVISGR